jgi:hypothetical protein
MLTLLALPALSAAFATSERGQSVALHVRITRVAIQEANRAHEEQRRQSDAEFEKAMAETEALLEARLRELRAGDDPFRQAMESTVPEAGQKKTGPTTRPHAAPQRHAQNPPVPERRGR